MGRLPPGLSGIDRLARAREQRRWLRDWIEEFIARELFVPTASRAREAARSVFGTGVGEARLVNTLRAYRRLGMPVEPPRPRRPRRYQSPYRVYFVPVGTPEEVAAAEERLIAVLARLIDE